MKTITPSRLRELADQVDEHGNSGPAWEENAEAALRFAADELERASQQWADKCNELDRERAAKLAALNPEKKI
jgi:hypothetical protein